MAKLTAKHRTESGSRAARRLRETGLIPGIIYGHGETPQAITVSEHDMEVALIHGERVLEVDLEGALQNVLVKEVQWDVFGHEVLHVDLARVNLDEKVVVTVPVVLKGTPAGVKEGGVLAQPIGEVSVECAVRSIPEEIDVPVAELAIGDQIFLRDIEMPEGVELQDDPEQMLCQVEYAQEELEEEAEAAEGASLEPEVIGEKRDDEGEAETK